jgi:hypothetical protein
MKSADWALLLGSSDEWTVKRARVISELNKKYGDRFASPHGDLIRLKAPDGRVLDVRAVSPEEYRIGSHFHIADDTGAPVAADKLNYHIGSFANGSVG